jgi:hypothetical protein
MSPITQTQLIIPSPAITPNPVPISSAPDVASDKPWPDITNAWNIHKTISTLKIMSAHLANFPNPDLCGIRSCTPHFGHFSAASLTSVVHSGHAIIAMMFLLKIKKKGEIRSGLSKITVTLIGSS